MSCPVCHNQIAEGVIRDNIVYYGCPRCGKYELGILAEHEIKFWTTLQRSNLSGWIHEHQGCRILKEDITRLASLRALTVGEKAQRLMLYLAKTNPKPGEYIKFASSDEIVGVCWVQDNEELGFILYHYLINEQQFIERATDNFSRQCLRITPKGWSYLDEVLTKSSDSHTGFIAMWFDDSMNDAWVAIENGIRDAGYKPFRVDQKEHNNDITDEIIAGIRGCKFLVADLTGHRNGVYYEAGFAKGLDLEVVWLCRKSDEKDRHFDIRQLSTIFWEEDKLPELSKALQNRIEATIGRGPLTANALP